MNFQMFKLDLEKSEDSKIKLPTSVESSKKQELKKNIYSLIDYTKALTVWITTNCGKFFKRWGYIKPPDLPLEKSVCRSGSNS